MKDSQRAKRRLWVFWVAPGADQVVGLVSSANPASLTMRGKVGRIRTIKPEFWEDEKVGLLSREARLLMLATFNLADDEGLLRWTPAYIKASVFMYDEDITPAKAEKTMKELAESGIIFPYSGGISQQPLAIIVNFRKHQKINRPQPGKLPAPSIQNSSVKSMYARRDGWICSLCGLPISNPPTNNDSLNLSLDHIIHASKGGGDYPSNIRATHQACNKGRRDRDDEIFTTPHSVLSMFDSVNNSGKQSLPEGKGREAGKEQGREGSAQHDTIDTRILSESVGIFGMREQADMNRLLAVYLKDSGKSVNAAIEAMIARWKDYQEAMPDLEWTYSSSYKFFCSGNWDKPDGWPRQRRTSAEAAFLGHGADS